MKKRIFTIMTLAALLLPFGISAQSHRNQGAGNHRGNVQTERPGGNNQNRPGGNSNVKPGGNNQNRPGGNSNVKPGGNNQNRPGGNSAIRPGGNQNHRPDWGQSAPRPGVGATPSPRPNNFMRPPRLNRWERPLPPRPVFSGIPVYGAPTISNILGLTFGTLIDFGVRTLLGAGYQIAGTWDNAIYLNNVSQFGLVWPQATIYYGVGGMNGARFQYSSYSPSTYNFNAAYNALCAAYGFPVAANDLNGTMTRTWWGGNNTGYITLQYGPGYGQDGRYMYYTDLIYGQ